MDRNRNFSSLSLLKVKLMCTQNKDTIEGYKFVSEVFFHMHYFLSNSVYGCGYALAWTAWLGKGKIQNSKLKHGLARHNPFLVARYLTLKHIHET